MSPLELPVRLAASHPMLHAVQPWLPLLHPELSGPPPMERPGGASARKVRRRPAVEAQAAVGSPGQRAARQAYLGLVACWDLSAAEALRLLGEPSGSEEERARRLDALLGVRRSLLLIAPEPARCVEALRRPEPAFNGACLLEAMLGGGLPAIGRVGAQLAARARGP